MKQLLCFCLIIAILSNPVFIGKNFLFLNEENKAFAQGELSPLDILVLDLKDIQNLIKQGENKQAIVILKSAEKEVRKVKEFDKETKSITAKRIKKGISLLKKNKNDEALALLQTGIDALVEGGFIEPGSFN